MTEARPTRRILVFATGEATAGIAVADELAASGHALLVALSPGHDRAGDDRVRFVPFDEDADDIEGAVRSLFEAAGAVDAVIFATSEPTQSTRVEDLTSAAWSKALRRNATLPFLVSKAAVPVLRQAKDPRMVFLLPEGVRGMPEPGEAASISPQAALVGLLRTYALELGLEGVTANAVAFPQPGLGSSRVTRTPRAPDYKDVAAAVSFFLSPASSFITGKTLDVNGGRSML